MDLISGVHPNLAHLSWMPGSWRGIGFVEFQDGHRADVEFTMSLSSSGEEFLSYQLKAALIDMDGKPLENILEESGTWFGQAPHAVRLQIGHHVSSYLPAINVWTGKGITAGIEDAKITLARVDLKFENHIRQYGIAKDQVLFSHALQFIDENSSIVQLEVIMQRDS